MSAHRIALIVFGALFLLPIGSTETAPPPPRDAGPARFVPPPPREPIETDAGAPSPFTRTAPVSAEPEATTDTPAKPTPASTTTPARPSPAPASKTATSSKTTPAVPPTPAKTTPPRPAKKTAVPRPVKSKRSAIAAHASAAATVKKTAIVSGENDKSQLSTAGTAFLVQKFDLLPEKRGLAARHYPASNENRIDLFRGSISGLGGGYLGVGTDQNLTFIAWARSSHAWLMDFDPVSVGINKIHIYFLKRARDYTEFHRLWQPKNKKQSLALIKKHFQNDPYRPHVLRAFAVAHGSWAPVPARLRELKSFTKRFGLSSFHNNPDDYRYLRNMALAGRLQALPGDLRGSTSMKAIHASALALGAPIRVVYTSNAEDYFRAFPSGFRSNMIDVPGDAKSVILRTISRNNYIYGQPPGEKFPRKAPFHYNVQTLDSFKSWLLVHRPISMHSIMPGRKRIRKGFSIIATSPTGKPAGKINDGMAPAKNKDRTTPGANKPDEK